jgi:S-adenosylmethionine:tRNA ribosyltransferase-isomerase
MKAASWPRRDRDRARLLHVALHGGGLSHHLGTELPGLLAPGDVLVVNDAATLPASLAGHADGIGPIELRLIDENAGAWRAVVFSAGSWRVPTERRPPPPDLPPGTRLRFGGSMGGGSSGGVLSATVEAHLEPSPRLLVVRFDQVGAAFWSGLYRMGRPVQYSYVNGPLQLWHVQNRYAARPWAAEAPSAGFLLTAELLAALSRRGVEVVSLTHAAGLSAVGDAAIDAALPLEERFEIPSACVTAITRARAAGGRVVAVGTSVVRALESRALEANGAVLAGGGRTTLRIGPGFRLRVVDGLLTGIHDPSASHFALLEALAPRPLLDRAFQAAERAGYLEHEFGDVCLLL